MNSNERLDKMLREAAGDIGRIPSVADRVSLAIAGQARPRAGRIRMGWWLSAAAVIVACIGAYFLLCSNVAGPEIAWADVTTQIGKASNMTCLLASRFSDAGEPIYEQRIYLKSPNTVRTEPVAPASQPASQAASQPASRSGSQPASATAADRMSYGIRLFNVPDGPDVVEMYTDRQRMLRIGSSQLKQSSNQPMDLLRAFKAIQADDVAKDGEEIIDGVKTLKFEATLKQPVLDALNYPYPLSGKMTVWISPSSGLPVRARIAALYKVPGLKKELNLDEVMDKMEWNVPLPDDFFEIPPGHIDREYWRINLSDPPVDKDFVLEGRLSDGNVIVTSEDGRLGGYVPGMKVWALNPDREETLEQTTRQNIGKVIVLNIAGRKIERKIRYPIRSIVVEFPKPVVATSTSSASATSRSSTSSAPVDKE